MTDYFALLGVERRPWLDDEELKARFHALTLQHHPDAAGASDEAKGFTAINKGYQTVREPTRRLQHLLRLERITDAVSGSIPSDLEELFSAMHETIRNAASVSTNAQAATSALARGLLQGDLLKTRVNVEKVAERLRQLQDAGMRELHVIDDGWDDRTPETFARLQQLQHTFAFVSRWLQQLDEAKFQLAQF